MMEIGFIGLGKLGLECAEAIARKYKVTGYDLLDVNSSKIIITKQFKEVVINKKYIFIAVETPHDKEYSGSTPTSHLPPKDFNYDQVKNVLREISHHIQSDQTIFLISTVLPGTCREQFLPLIPSGVNFIYNPYLIAMGTTTWDMLNPEMVIIGTNYARRERFGGLRFYLLEIENFYKSILEKKDARFEYCSLEEAECIKIFYNTFISFKIGFVNMIQDVAEVNGNIDCDIVAKALSNSTQRLISDMYMKPGMGDGGPCHPRDNIALRYLAKKLDLGYDLFDAIMTTREVQAKRLADKLSSYDMPIIILGKSFKPDVDYEDGSYALLVGSYCNVAGYDNNVTDKSCVYLLSHRGCYHDFEFNKGSVVIDPWGELMDKRNIDIVYYGRDRRYLG